MEVKKRCLRKKRNGKKEKTKNGKKRNGRIAASAFFECFFL